MSLYLEQIPTYLLQLLIKNNELHTGRVEGRIDDVSVVENLLLSFAV